jgi:hypothetical protein
MDTDVRPAAHMPAPVLAAAVLLGLFGALAGLGTVAYGLLRVDEGGGPLLLVGLGILVAVGACVFAFVNRYRTAQIAAGVLGVFGLLAGVTALMQGNPLNAVWAVVAVIIGALVVVPMSARMWFTP